MAARRKLAKSRVWLRTPRNPENLKSDSGLIWAEALLDVAHSESEILMGMRSLTGPMGPEGGSETKFEILKSPFRIQHCDEELINPLVERINYGCILEKNRKVYDISSTPKRFF